MSSNLWNTNSPTKRIDLYFKIDVSIGQNQDYKKHLIHLKNAKSTYKKSLPFFIPNNNSAIDLSASARLKSRKVFAPLTKNKIRQKSPDCNRQHVQSARITTQVSQSQRDKGFQPYKNSFMDQSRINSSTLTSTASPNKYQKFRDRQINQENKMILKKLQNVKASPELSKKKLFHKYSMSDLKYRINLQKTKYKNVDFTKAAEKLIKGQKIKFSKIKMGSVQSSRKKENVKIYQVNLDWKLSKKQIPSSIMSQINLPKAFR